VIHLIKEKLAAVLQTSALGGPTLSTGIEACVDINYIVFSGGLIQCLDAVNFSSSYYCLFAL
jgi:hypothetical protein